MISTAEWFWGSKWTNIHKAHSMVLYEAYVEKIHGRRKGEFMFEMNNGKKKAVERAKEVGCGG